MKVSAEGLALVRGGNRILDGIDLDVPGGIFVLMGPTGCGKTSLLRVLSLLDRPDRGTVFLDGRAAPEGGRARLACRRRIVMLFQRPILFRGTVRANVSWGLRIRGEPADSVRRRTGLALEMVGLEGFGERSAGTLSGGEIQRTALARALAVEPELLVLDEPTAFLDPPFRDGLRRRLRELQERTGTTFLVATHDFSDALGMGTDGALMRDGSIHERGSIEELFHRPSSRLAAEFVGMDNVIAVAVDGPVARAGNLEIHHASDRQDGRFLALPAEAVVISRRETRTSERNRFPAVVTGIDPAGRLLDVSVECGGVTIVSRITHAAADELGVEPGSEVWVSWKATAVHLF